MVALLLCLVPSNRNVLVVVKDGINDEEEILEEENVIEVDGLLFFVVFIRCDNIFLITNEEE